MASIDLPLLVLLGHILPHIGANETALDRVVGALGDMADDIQGDQELVPVVQNLIVGLERSPAITQGQTAAIDALKARLDASMTTPDPAPAPVPDPAPAPAPAKPAVTVIKPAS